MKYPPAFPPIPESESDLVRIFGDLRRHIVSDGTLSDQWEPENIVRIVLPSPVPYAYGPKPITHITVHKKLQHVATALYSTIWLRGLNPELGPYGGGFVYRANRNDPSIISTHAYGIAWDWWPNEFPNGSKKQRDPDLVATFAEFGFLCGQNFKKTKDPMHFQFALNL